MLALLAGLVLLTLVGFVLDVAAVLGLAAGGLILLVGASAGRQLGMLARLLVWTTGLALLALILVATLTCVGGLAGVVAVLRIVANLLHAQRCSALPRLVRNLSHVPVHQ